MQHKAAAFVLLVLALAGAAITVVVSPQADPAPVAASGGVGVEVRATDLESRLMDIEKRLQRWEARGGFATELPMREIASPVTPVIDLAALAELTSRIAALEAGVVGVRNNVANLAAFELPSPDSELLDKREVAAAVQSVSGQGLGEALGRIPLRVRFLQQWPRDPLAREMLDGLLMDYRVSCQPQKVSAAIDYFGARMGLPQATLDDLRLDMLPRDADRIEIASRILQGSSEATARVNARYVMASCMLRLGMSGEATRAMQALAEEWGATEIGRTYLERLERQRANGSEGR